MKQKWRQIDGIKYMILWIWSCDEERTERTERTYFVDCLDADLG